MTFDFNKSVEILSRTPVVLDHLLHGLSSEWLKNNEGEGTWTPYDILGHLIHGEKTDWIPRAEIMLSNSVDKTFTPFDRFAQAKEDQTRSIQSLLEEFKVLRASNLKKLQALEINDTKLKQQGVHPELGKVNLKELLSSWVVHDLGHIAQISRVMAKQYTDEVGPWIAYLGILNR